MICGNANLIEIIIVYILCMLVHFKCSAGNLSVESLPDREAALVFVWYCQVQREKILC